MKKIALVLTLCMFLAGCGGEKQEIENTEPETAATEQGDMEPQGLDVDGTFIGSASLE